MRIILIRFNLQHYVKSSAFQSLMDTLKIQVRGKKKESKFILFERKPEKVSIKNSLNSANREN